MTELFQPPFISGTARDLYEIVRVLRLNYGQPAERNVTFAVEVAMSDLVDDVERRFFGDAA